MNNISVPSSYEYLTWPFLQSSLRVSLLGYASNGAFRFPLGLLLVLGGNCKRIGIDANTTNAKFHCKQDFQIGPACVHQITTKITVKLLLNTLNNKRTEIYCMG